MTKKNLLLPFLFSFVALVSGCGSADSTTTSLTKANFIQEAEKVCQRAEGEQLKGLAAFIEHHPGAKEEDAVVPVALPPLEKEIQQIKDLGVPMGGAEEAQAFIREFEKALTDAKEDPGEVLAGAANPFKKADQLAKAYGMKYCAGAP